MLDRKYAVIIQDGGAHFLSSFEHYRNEIVHAMKIFKLQREKEENSPDKR